MENKTLNLGQLCCCEVHKDAHEVSLYCKNWLPLDHQSNPNQVGKITFTPDEDAQPLPQQVVRLRPGSVEVKFTVVDPLERMALFVLQSRDYIVYKKNCGPASLD